VVATAAFPQPVSGWNGAPQLVLDTNIVLDIWLFSDPRSAWVLPLLRRSACVWLASGPMQAELVRVLAYPGILRQLALRAVSAADVQTAFANYSQTAAPAPAAPRHLTCQDADDQKFIDLAWAHSAQLLSRDRAVGAVMKRFPATQ